jgi:hypothetical protein
VLQIIILVAIVWLASRYYDTAQIRLALQSLSPVAVLGFFLLMITVRGLDAYRWLTISRVIIDKPGLSWSHLFRTALLAEFFLVWLPSFVGAEAVRIWKLGELAGDRRGAALSVVSDRLVGLLALLFLSIPIILSVMSVPALLSAVGSNFVGLIVAGLIIIGLGIFTLTRFAAIAVRLGAAWQTASANRFFAWPIFLAACDYPLMMLAYMAVFAGHAPIGALELAAFVVLPRLGRVVPLSAVGFTAVEGSSLVVGSWLGLDPAVVLIATAMNVSTKYACSAIGIVDELAGNGRDLFRRAAVIESTASSESSVHTAL